MTTVTENERRVLRALLTNYFTATNGAIPARFDRMDFEVWSNCINDSNEPSGLEGLALAGVCGSLAQKGLVRGGGSGRDACIALTQAGFDVATA